jgi:hypothetical protein
MPDIPDNPFNLIRQAIADGEGEAAIRQLATQLSAGDPLHDSLILLENRLGGLQQSVLEGIISREDALIEQNSINKGLLQLVKTLEQRSAAPTAPPTPLKPAPTTSAAAPPPTADANLAKRKAVQLIGLFAVLALVVVAWYSAQGSKRQPTRPPQDWAVQISLSPAQFGTQALGKAQLFTPVFASEALETPPNMRLLFRQLPGRLSADSLQLRLPDFKFKHRISRQPATEASVLAFDILLETDTFAGQVLRPNLQPAAGIELDIEQGLARVVTDANGRFRFVLPDWGATSARMVMRRGGKVLEDRKMGLHPAVFREIKIAE